MLVDTIFYFYGVKIMKNIDNKVKLDGLFKDLNFNVSELKRMYNKYNSPLKFSEFISYYEELVTRMNFLYNYIKKLEELVEIKSDNKGLLLTKSKFIILSQIFITSLLLVLDFTPYLIGGISNTTIYQLSLLVVLYGNR